MIPSLRQQFNANFTPEKYQRLLQLVAERCGTPVQFRICETPCFFPKSLLHQMAQCGKELRSEEHTSELQSRFDLVCRLLLEKKKKSNTTYKNQYTYPTRHTLYEKT